MGDYVPFLDPDRHVVASRRDRRRHRVIDHLLGGPALCPVVRRTPGLDAWMGRDLGRVAKRIVEPYDPTDLMRAVAFLYTKETRSSFAIESETPSRGRTERFVRALRSAFELGATDANWLVALQGEIVDPRYAADEWRTAQSFIGSTVPGFRQEVHYVGPRPEDVPELMTGWSKLSRRCLDEALHPVVAAAVLEDGSGPITDLVPWTWTADDEMGAMETAIRAARDSVPARPSQGA